MPPPPAECLPALAIRSAAAVALPGPAWAAREGGEGGEEVLTRASAGGGVEKEEEEGWVTRHGRRRRRRRHRAARRGTRGPLAAPGRHLGGRDGGKGEGGRGTETGGHDFDDVGGTQVVDAHLLLENAQVLQSYYP